MYNCKICQRDFEKKQSLGSHMRQHSLHPGMELQPYTYEKKLKREWLQPNGMYKCPECVYEGSKYGIGKHIWMMHGEGKEKPHPALGASNWSKGQTKNTSEVLKKRGEIQSSVTKGRKKPKHTIDERVSIAIGMREMYRKRKGL
jgi:hypothetical protein